MLKLDAIVNIMYFVIYQCIISNILILDLTTLHCKKCGVIFDSVEC